MRVACERPSAFESHKTHEPLFPFTPERVSFSAEVSESRAGQETLRKMKRGGIVATIAAISILVGAFAIDTVFLGAHSISYIMTLFGSEGLLALGVFGGTIAGIMALYSLIIWWDKKYNDPNQIKQANREARKRDARESRRSWII